MITSALVQVHDCYAGEALAKGREMAAMQVVEFPVGAGGTLLVKVADEPTGGPTVRGIRSEQVIQQADRTFEQALQTVREVAQGVLGQLQGLAVMPQEVTVEFGIELTGRTGAILVAAGASAQLKVGLTWRPAANSSVIVRQAVGTGE
jgi:Trypsin-co-occurring domain 1